MKLAEALQERADLNRKIEQLNSRICSNVLVQEGEQPNEDPAAMLKELSDCIDRLGVLIRQINQTNCKSTLDGESLTDLIARKDMLTLRSGRYRDIINAASRSVNRIRNTEIKIITAVDVKQLRKEADQAAKELRLVDNKLQQANWTIELIEN